MKRLYFFLLLAFPYFLKGQTFTYQPTSGSLTMVGSDTITLICYVDIYNSSSTPLNVLCRISSSNMTTGHSKYFCFGPYCYDTSTVVAYSPVPINPGKHETLNAYVVPNHLTGIDDVTYQFYDANGNSDTLTFTVHYNFSVTGVADIKKPAYSLSVASPNPANNLTAITYDFPSAKEARIVFYNLLGSTVKEMKLQNNRGVAFVETASLNAGIYLYTLFVDGNAVASKKLIVTH